MNTSEFVSGKDAFRIAELILNHALADPKISATIEEMIADQSLERIQLCHTSFAHGVIATLAAIKEGGLIPVSNN